MEKNEIIICQGSSCFSRGNKENLKAIQSFLSLKNLSVKIGFKGQLCTANCQKGPVIKINGTVFSEVNPNNIGLILTNALNI